MRLRTGMIVAVSLFLVVGAVAWSAQESATVGAVTGGVRVDPGGTPLDLGGTVEQGQTVTLDAGATLTLTFPDGSVMDVAGPASFKATLLTDTARTIDLLSGSINRFEAKGVVTGIRTPFDSFVAAQNGTVSVGLSSTPGMDRATFTLLEGEPAKVVDGQNLMVLTADNPITVDRPATTAPTAPLAAAPGGGEDAEFDLGGHTVTVHPKGGFSIQELPGGGIRISRTGEGTGVVSLDDNSKFYLAQGEYIDLSSDGVVIGHNGVVHIFGGTSYHGLHVDPVPGPAAASFTGTQTR